MELVNTVMTKIDQRRTDYIKKITFDQGIIKIKGLAWDGMNSARRIEFSASYPLEALPSIRLHLPSPEAEDVIGRYPVSAGFEIEIPIISLQNLTKIAFSFIIIEFSDIKREKIPLFPQKIIDALRHTDGFSALKVGIGITTWNRQDLISETVKTLQEKTFLPVEIFVSDDGSSDATPSVLKSIAGISWLSARNRGIAWNKNRALFYLHQIRRCHVVLLMEDDVQPIKEGWDIDWVLAALSYGHVNHAPAWFLKDGDSGTWDSPLQSPVVSGQCSGFSSEALSYVGYLDSRFRRYGHEHVEHTLRLIRAGYGGTVLQEGTRNSLFSLISGGLRIIDANSSGNSDAVKENGNIFDSIWNESIYRSPWRTDDEMMALRQEIFCVTNNIARKRTSVNV